MQFAFTRKASISAKSKRQSQRWTCAERWMPGACERLLEELLRCVETSDCVLNKGRKPHDCADATECEGPRQAYAKCRRGMIDPRSRIRGNKGA